MTITAEGQADGHRYVMGNVNAHCPRCAEQHYEKTGQLITVLDCNYDIEDEEPMAGTNNGVTDFAEFEQYRVDSETFWEAGRMVDGYDRMDLAGKRGWRSISGWGRDGWDLGDWPYVVIYFREREGTFEYAQNVEGDTEVYVFPTEELRNGYTDRVAFWYWKQQGRATWVEGIDTFDQLPAHMRGPFSWKRLEDEKPAAGTTE